MSASTVWCICFVIGEDEDESQAVDLIDEPVNTAVKRYRQEITGVHVDGM